MLNGVQGDHSPCVKCPREQQCDALAVPAVILLSTYWAYFWRRYPLLWKDQHLQLAITRTRLQYLATLRAMYKTRRKSSGQLSVRILLSGSLAQSTIRQSLISQSLWPLRIQALALHLIGLAFSPAQVHQASNSTAHNELCTVRSRSNCTTGHRQPTNSR